MKFSPPKLPITPCKIFSEAKRVLHFQPGRFIALAFLILFPINPFLVLKQHDQIFLSIYLLISSVIYLCTEGLIAYAALRCFNGVPVDLKSAVKSISVSFFSLLATFLLMLLPILAASLLVSIVANLLVHLSHPLSHYFLVSLLHCFLVLILIVAVLYIQLNWYLVFTIFVAESRLAFEPLKRSRGLIKGKRWLALGLNLIFGIFYAIFVYEIKSLVYNSNDSDHQCLDYMALLNDSNLLKRSHRFHLVSMVVLYAYCDGADEFSGEYFVLPVDDKKVDLIV